MPIAGIGATANSFGTGGCGGGVGVGSSSPSPSSSLRAGEVGRMGPAEVGGQPKGAYAPSYTKPLGPIPSASNLAEEAAATNPRAAAQQHAPGGQPVGQAAGTLHDLGLPLIDPSALVLDDDPDFLQSPYYVPDIPAFGSRNV
mmetsp:Transcript_52017/g.103310  ORF Transcript_52017/g.103310 Transcript_52017/m.103310 type:complete len:143 (-) Transcript_52017:129-557(-)